MDTEYCVTIEFTRKGTILQIVETIYASSADEAREKAKEYRLSLAPWYAQAVAIEPSRIKVELYKEF